MVKLPDGFTLKLMSSQKQHGTVTDNDLRRYASAHLARGAQERPVQYGIFDGFAIDCIPTSDPSKDETEVYLKAENIFVMAVISGRLRNEDAHSGEVKEVLEQMTLKSSAG